MKNKLTLTTKALLEKFYLVCANSTLTAASG
jgi:hypothetical protein